jgi:hypothetical protein
VTDRRHAEHPDGEPVNAGKSALAAAKAAAIDAAQARPLTWKSVVKRALAVAVAGAAIYLALPKLVAVLGAWPRLSTLPGRQRVHEDARPSVGNRGSAISRRVPTALRARGQQEERLAPKTHTPSRPRTSSRRAPSNPQRGSLGTASVLPMGRQVGSHHRPTRGQMGPTRAFDFPAHWASGDSEPHRATVEISFASRGPGVRIPSAPPADSGVWPGQKLVE